jgi:hypothetical protein
MSLIHSPGIVTDGLVAAFDAENLKSYGGVNLIANSNSFNTSGWGTGGLTLTAAATTGPYGESASRMTETTASAQHLLSYNISTVVIGETFTWSASFKPESNVTQVVLHTNGEGTVTFNLTGASAGTVASTSGANTIGSSITPEPNGWFRCAATFRKNNTVGVFYVSNQRGLGAYVGDASFSYFVCNAQLQTSRSVTAYQATTGVAGNRLSWVDQVGSSTATLSGGAHYSGTLRGMSFNGTSNLVTIPPDAFNLSNFTVSLWFKANSIGTAYTRILQKGDTTGATRGFLIAQGNANNKIVCAYQPNYNTGEVLKRTNVTLTNGVIYNLVMTHSNANSALVYLNGVNVTENTASPESLWGAGTGNGFRMGSRSNDNSQFWNGEIYNVSIYSRELTSAEVLRNYTALRGRFGV